MSSYTHTCAACGLEMTVHERYFGRRLRCRDCRAEFVADPETGETPSVPSESSHTCTACGTRMKVSERYYGRTLRCTECGEPFVVRLPTIPQSPPADESPMDDVDLDEPVDPQARARRWSRIAWIAACAVLAGGLLWWLGGDREQGFGSSLFRSEKGRTQVGQLDGGDGGAVVVALERDGIEALIEVSKREGEAVSDDLVSSARYLQVPPGTRVRILETARGGGARVRILDGPQNSRVVWVPVAWIR